jgi:hypothetical protein
MLEMANFVVLTGLLPRRVDLIILAELRRSSAVLTCHSP